MIVLYNFNNKSWSKQIYYNYRYYAILIVCNNKYHKNKDPNEWNLFKLNGIRWDETVDKAKELVIIKSDRFQRNN